MHLLLARECMRRGRRYRMDACSQGLEELFGEWGLVEVGGLARLHEVSDLLGLALDDLAQVRDQATALSRLQLSLRLQGRWDSACWLTSSISSLLRDSDCDVAKRLEVSAFSVSSCACSRSMRSL